ncbi:MAG: cupin domain-containing protein [Oscillospiraceae bacterium]|jgi:quercetin dioxygenase-like cupin family protein|nr:cupin domain-containing protein [Oscillospiraceae bacterium]
MIIKAGDLPAEARERMRGGEGAVQISHAATADTLPPGLRLHAKITLPPGAGIGEHAHEHETELFYVLQGQGEILENGVWTPLSPGDAASTGGGQSHALRNTGGAPFVLMATIVNER